MKYTYKNKTYTLIAEGQSKDKSSREWYNIVIYKQDESGMVFVRESVDFYFKFDLVEE